jgi:hypothetical protein
MANANIFLILPTNRSLVKNQGWSIKQKCKITFEKDLLIFAAFLSIPVKNK